MIRRMSLAPPVFEGAGTYSNPYKVSSASDLAMLATLVNANNSTYIDKYYLQTQDISLSAYANWTPIGVGYYFSGMYNGNGKKITNLNIDVRVAISGRTYGALFGFVSGQIKNLEIASTVTGIQGISVSAFCYTLTGIIRNCINRAPILGNAPSGTYCYAGGFCYTTLGAGTYLFDCVNFGSITMNSSATVARDAGGLVGLNSLSRTYIYNCFSAGAITGNFTMAGVFIGSSQYRVSESYYDSTVITGVTFYSGTALLTANCQGANARANMTALDWVDKWKVVTDDYPKPIVFN